jgi:hypothetical protein
MHNNSGSRQRNQEAGRTDNLSDLIGKVDCKNLNVSQTKFDDSMGEGISPPKLRKKQNAERQQPDNKPTAQR